LFKVNICRDDLLDKLYKSETIANGQLKIDRNPYLTEQKACPFCFLMQFFKSFHLNQFCYQSLLLFSKAAVDRFQSERTDAFQKVRLKSLKNLLLNRPRFMRAVIELRAQMDR
ncbi:hypothetical protein D917_02647, partial [Trichinella nativa]